MRARKSEITRRTVEKDLKTGMGLFDKIFGRKQPSTNNISEVPMQNTRWMRIMLSGGCCTFARKNPTELKLHDEVQNTECDAWKMLLALIEETHAKRKKEFDPVGEMGWEKWDQIVTLPRSIGLLKSVKLLNLGGSSLVRIPPEIGEMEKLTEFDPYGSYNLHWFPYEITRCKRLRKSRVSTRALYGNYKHRPSFPRLPANPPAVEQSRITEVVSPAEPLGRLVIKCSICNRWFPQSASHQVWISLIVATDVLPLLVNACSEECIKCLPPPAKGYVNRSHKGGLDLVQPSTEERPRRLGGIF